MKQFRIALITLFLAACGFHPLYQNTNTLAGGTSILDTVWIDIIPDANGVYLRNALIDRFYHNGMPADPKYQLHVTITEDSRNLAIKKNDTTSRAQLVIRASYTLKDRATDRILETAETRAVSSYNVLNSQYTTLVTQGEARNAALTELADKLTTRTAVLLEQKP
jgi:LPS-assembly lipoprotein